MSTTLPTLCDDKSLSMAMDAIGRPHCVWTDGTHIRYATFLGEGWVTVGDTAVAVSGSNLGVSRHSIAFDGHGNCMFAYRDGADVKLATWNGAVWTTEVAWTNAGRGDVLACSLSYGTFPVVVVMTKLYGTRTMWATDKSSGSWSSPVGMAIPPQDNDEVELKASTVTYLTYVFWIGRNEADDTGWIGHLAWNHEIMQWEGNPSSIVEMSFTEASISGLDFVTTNTVDPMAPPYMLAEDGTRMALGESDGLGGWILLEGFEP